jgi:hypothetical protein
MLRALLPASQGSSSQLLARRLEALDRGAGHKMALTTADEDEARHSIE